MNIHSPRAARHRALLRRKAGQVRNGVWRGVPARLFAPLLERVDKGLLTGSLELHLPDGEVRLLGARAPGFSAVVHLTSYRALARLAMGGSTGWYRAWAAGDWSSPDPVQIFALFGANARSLGTAARSSGLSRLIGRLKFARRHNNRRGARRNIAEHYDLGNDFYSLWLDETLTYSSACPEFPNESMASAQRRKIDRLLARLELEPDDRLLEIGCGWGGLAERALDRHGVRYTGLTLSAEQRAVVQERLGQYPDAEVRLQDYRDVEGSFDAIASVEMVEAVGERYWPAYLGAVAKLLRPGGRAAIQFISIDD